MKQTHRFPKHKLNVTKLYDSKQKGIRKQTTAKKHKTHTVYIQGYQCRFKKTYILVKNHEYNQGTNLC